MAAAPATNRFSALDGWRAVAALIIALHRLDVEGYHSKLPFVVNSYLFVDFFFVLSGFVITHAYWAKLWNVGSFVNFAIRRFGRLWPLHFSMLVAFVLLEYIQYYFGLGGANVVDFSDPNQLLSIASHASLTQALGFTPEFAAQWNVPSWSISVEFWTYLVFGLMCIGFRRNFFALACTIVGGSILIIGLFSPNNMHTAFDYGLARCFAGFFMGYLCYRTWTVYHDDINAALERFGSTRMEIAVVALALVFVSLAETSMLSLFAPLFFAPLILVFAFEKGSLSSVMRRPLSVELGALSYSIYMIALLVVTVIVQAAKQADARFGFDFIRPRVVEGKTVEWLDIGSPLANDIFAIGYLVIIILGSFVTYRLIEVPGRRFFNSLASRVIPRPRAPVPSAG